MSLRRMAGRMAAPVFAALMAPWPRPAGIGRPVTRVAFLQSIPRSGDILEIGPFNAPKFTGGNVSYLDVLDREGLMARARSIGLDPSGCPEIDYVSPVGSLDTVDRSFDSVFSSHCIEHQPDLIGHLQQVESILVPGGAYYLIVPDKRFCFDHYLAPSMIEDVMAAHRERRTVHTAESIRKHRLHTTHNSAWRHWLGDHGLKPDRENDEALMESVRAEWDAARAGTYVDVHAWFFTPSSFKGVMDSLGRNGLIALELESVCQTLFGQFEFFAVLRKPW